MLWGAEVQVALSKIVAPGDLAARMKKPSVIALAATFKDLGGGPGNPLWVKRVRLGWQLIAGRDRLAAMMLNGVKKWSVKPVEDATPEDIADLEEVENLYRREVSNRDELIARRVEKLAARFAAEPRDSGHASAKPGRPVTPEGRAREQVAAETGRSKEAVRKAQARVRKHDDGAGEREEGAARMPTDASGTNSEGCTRPGSPPPIDLHGHEMPPQMMDIGGLVKQYAAIEKTAKALREQCAALELYNCALAGSTALLVNEAEKFIALVRAEAPTDLCPKCHGVEGVRCGLCNERGWVKADKYRSAPAEQRLAAPKKPAARVVLVGEDGSKTEVA